MRKAEFRKKAERTEQGKFIFYKSLSYRWEDGETADPQRGDTAYHLTENEARIAADKIDLDLGFEAQVERITIPYDEFNETVDFGQDFELGVLDNYRISDSETIYESEVNKGSELNPDSIVVFYRHKTYMNYAYSIDSVRFIFETNLKFESDLRNDSDSLSSIYCRVFKDLDELSEAFRFSEGVPFNKLNSGWRIVREFLKENNHPDFVEEEKEEEVE